MVGEILSEKRKARDHRNEDRKEGIYLLGVQAQEEKSDLA